MQYGKWLKAKPKFNEECTFITATYMTRQKVWNYDIWQIQKLDGYNDNDEPAWYWGLLCGDGCEWGDLADLTAGRYFVVPKIKSKEK